ncbi:hypothetical protein FB45DRAFT_1063076, partial [Roridomyces roridus]
MSRPLSHLTRLEPEAGSSSRWPSPQPNTRPSQPESNAPRDASRTHSRRPSPQPNPAPEGIAGGPSQAGLDAPGNRLGADVSAEILRAIPREHLEQMWQQAGVSLRPVPNAGGPQDYIIDMTGSTWTEETVYQMGLRFAEILGSRRPNIYLQNGTSMIPIQVHADSSRPTSASAERATFTSHSVPPQPRPPPGGPAPTGEMTVNPAQGTAGRSSQPEANSPRDTSRNHSRRPSAEPNSRARGTAGQTSQPESNPPGDASSSRPVPDFFGAMSQRDLMTDAGVLFPADPSGRHVIDMTNSNMDQQAVRQMGLRFVELSAMPVRNFYLRNGSSTEPLQVDSDANVLRLPSAEPVTSTSSGVPGQPRPPPRGSTPGESPVNSTAFWFHHLRIVEDHPGRPDSAPYGVYTAPGNRHAISTLDITDFEMDRNELSRRIQQVRQGSHQPPRGFADYIFNDDFGVLLYTDNDGRIVDTWTNGVADRIPAFRDDSIRENSTVVWYRLLALRAGMRFSSVGTPGNAEDMANSYLRSHPLGVLDISNMDFSETQMSDRIEIIPRSDIPNTTDVFRSRHGRHAWEVLIQDGDTADLVWTRGRRPNGRMGRSSTNNAPQPTGSPVIGSSTFIGRNSTNDAPRPTGNRDAIVQFWGQALSRFPCEIDRDNTSGTCTFVLTEADQEADLMLQVLETARTPNCPYPVRILRAD